ncbi:MAG: hypothetical protein Q8Q31_05855 [Nanoarchaeota archaeon]|nr:hypothetical protein [Nanoarchaeota archaeon]
MKDNHNYKGTLGHTSPATGIPPTHIYEGYVDQHGQEQIGPEAMPECNPLGTEMPENPYHLKAKTKTSPSTKFLDNLIESFMKERHWNN